MALQRTAALALLCLACTRAPPGQKLASGIARGLIAGGGSVAYLLDAAHPGDRSVPDDLLAGDLWLDDRKVGSGVSTLDGAYAFSPADAELAFLAAWRFREGEGELWVAPRGGKPRRVAESARQREDFARLKVEPTRSRPVRRRIAKEIPDDRTRASWPLSSE